MWAYSPKIAKIGIFGINLFLCKIWHGGTSPKFTLLRQISPLLLQKYVLILPPNSQKCYFWCKFAATGKPRGSKSQVQTFRYAMAP